MSTIARIWGRRAGSYPILGLAATAAVLTFTSSAAQAADEKAKDPAKGAVKVSYDKQIRPIFQANCQGCHQPAKAGGDYVMTAFDRLLKGGKAGEAAIVPGKPADSHLVEQITPQGGKAEMPQNKPPLSAAEIELISKWIAQGAVNDSTQAASVRYDMAHLPEYTRLPVVGALDFSPDGSLLAIGGFHEVLLWKADGSSLVGRLVGLSERIESVAFSPDGKKLAVVGGLPARMGEVQVWDVAKRTLAMSVPVTYDTVYGVSWSPDGTKIAFGCADNGVRAIDAKTGAQLLFSGAHNDWALDTAFSVDGSHLVSVGRDMAAKLTEVATQRFVDNITSITPGALKGGLTSVARHPKRDEIVIGGSDGIPKVYRLFRETVRVIGDDSNLIRVLPGLPGRIFSVAVSDDGKRIAAGSSLDGSGEIGIYSYEFDTKLPDAIKLIQTKVNTTRSPAENEALATYHKEGVKQIADVKVPTAGIYAVSFTPDGKALAAAGADGTIRLIETETGKILKEFAPITVKPAGMLAGASAPTVPTRNEAAETPVTETFPSGAVLASIDVQPPSIKLSNRFDYVQLVVTAKLASGEAIDATRMVEPTLSANIAELSRSGLIRPKADGKAVLKLALAGKTIDVPVVVEGLTKAFRADFVHDVNPALSRLGCNQGTCHGSAQGKNGFKLSLRGYDPIYDVRALTDDHARGGSTSPLPKTA